MCRMAYFPNKTIAALKASTIAEVLKYLERTHGGDGNGFGGFIRGEPFFKKGVDLDMKDIAQFIKATTWDHGVIAHTRKASMGSVCDENCHPFLYDNVLLAHNGHWATGAKNIIKMMATLGQDVTGVSGERLIDMTDSEVIAYLVSKNGETITELAQGVIMTMTADHVRVHNHAGDFRGVNFSNTGVWLFMSTIPVSIEGDVFEMGRGAIMHLETGEPVIKAGVWHEYFTTYGYSETYQRNRGALPALPAQSHSSPPKKKKQRKSHDTIMDDWSARHEKMQRERDEVLLKNLKGGRVRLEMRSLTKSEKRHGRRAGYLILQKLRKEIPPSYWRVELAYFTHAERAAVEIHLQLSARTVDMPVLSHLDFVALVYKSIRANGGGTK